MILAKRGKKRIAPAAMATVWYTAANVISKAAAFVFTPIFTRLLTPDEYGVYFLYTGWLSVFTALCSLELSGSVTYRALTKFDKEKDTVLSASLGISLAFSLTFLLIYMIFKEQINALTTLSTPLTLLTVFQVLLNSAEGLFFAEKRYSCSYKTVSAISIASGLLSPVLAVFLIRFADIRAEARIIGGVASSLLFVVPMCVYIIKRGKKLYSGRIWRYLIKSCAPMLISHTAHTVSLQSEKLMISRLLGQDALGKYSVAYSLGYAISFISSGLSLSLTPWLMKRLACKEYKRARTVLEEATLLIAFATVFFLAAVPEIFSVLAPQSYRDAQPAVYPIALSAALGFLSSILGAVILYYERPFLMNASALVGAALSVGLGYISIRSFGIFGGAVSALVCALAILLLNLLFSHKLAAENLISAKCALQITILITFFGTTLFVFRNSHACRLLLLLAALLAALPTLTRTMRHIKVDK